MLITREILLEEEEFFSTMDYFHPWFSLLIITLHYPRYTFPLSNNAFDEEEVFYSIKVELRRGIWNEKRVKKLLQEFYKEFIYNTNFSIISY